MAAKLPEKKTAAQVIASVTRLENSAPMQAYRRSIPVYRQLVMMRLDEQIPDSYARGVMVSMPTTRVIRTMRILKTDTAGFPRYTDVMARSPKTGVPTRPLVGKADALGRRLTMMNATLDYNRKVTDPTRDHQLADGYAVWVLHRRKAPGDDDFSWEIEVANPLTCAFPEQTGGAYQPKTLGRRFKQYVRWLQDKYSDSGRHKGEMLTWTVSGTGDKRTGSWSWEPLAPARDPRTQGPAFGGAAGGGDGEDQEVDFITYDDGCYVYHVCCNQTGNDGTVVYCERNGTFEPPDDPDETPSYAAAAVVIAGDTFAVGGDGEKMLPVLMALLNIANSRNLIRAVRGIAALRDKPDMLVTADVTPAELDELKRLNAVMPTENAEGGDALVYAAGNRAVPWQLVSNQDLDKIALELKQEEDECVGEMTVNTQPDVISNATAQAYYTSTGATQRQKTNWLQNLDAGWLMVDRMICNAVVNEDETYSFTASTDISLSSGESVAQGESADLTPDDVDFDFDIMVATKEETEEQKSRRLLNALYLFDRQVRTFDQVLEEDTVDVVKRNKELAIDSGRRIAQPVLLGTYLPQVIQQRVLLRAGVLLPFQPGAFMPQAGNPAAPGLGGGGGAAPAPAATYQPAATEGAQGGAGTGG